MVEHSTMTIGAGVKLSIKGLNVWFGLASVLKEINIEVKSNELLSIVGPAGSGKTTFLRTLNRLNEMDANFKMTGDVELDGQNIMQMDLEALRKKVGMVFALPLPLPLSIFDNVAYGVKLHGINNKERLYIIVERVLKQAYLWDEVSDRLNESAYELSGGQQQRLCIARTLAVEPKVILFDEPCSGLDPISTAKVEEAMLKLKKYYTIILVTNNVRQAARVGDRTAFFLSGQLIELDETNNIFTAPKDKRTDDYIRGRFG